MSAIKCLPRWSLEHPFVAACDASVPRTQSSWLSLRNSKLFRQKLNGSRRSRMQPILASQSNRKYNFNTRYCSKQQPIAKLSFRSSKRQHREIMPIKQLEPNRGKRNPEKRLAKRWCSITLGRKSQMPQLGYTHDWCYAWNPSSSVGSSRSESKFWSELKEILTRQKRFGNRFQSIRSHQQDRNRANLRSRRRRRVSQRSNITSDRSWSCHLWGCCQRLLRAPVFRQFKAGQR